MCLMMFYISLKFHGNILNGFQVIEQTLLRDRWTERRTDGQKTKAKTIWLHPSGGDKTKVE